MTVPALTASQRMAMRTSPLRLVIYDCDGVLVDSELVASRVTAASLTRLGWPMTVQEAHTRFLGMTLTDMVPVIEAKLGVALPEAWKPSLMADLLDALGREVVPIPGAVEALRGTTALGIPWRVASNSSHEEMRAKFARIGIADIVAGRVHSHRDVGRGKPAPDLFLATAAAEGVAPECCIVIEDSMIGVRAAVAAGMECLAYAPHSSGDALRALGATPFAAMRDLPALFAIALQVTA